MRFTKSPVITSSFILVLLFFLFRLPIKRDILKCVIDKKDITHLEVTLTSPPVKLSSRRFYKALALVRKAEKENSTKSEASGTVFLLFPQNLVEYYRKGSVLPRLSYAPSLIEKGERMRLFVKYKSGKTFYVLSAPKSEKKSGTLKELRTKIRNITLSFGESSALITALLLGSREYLPASFSSAVSSSGVSHILALSGMHLSILALPFSFLSKYIFGRTLSRLLSFVAVLLFTAFSPPAPSLFRAFIFYFFSFLFALLFIKCAKMKKKEEELFSFTFILHVFLHPSHHFTASFLLSYSAFLGIILSPKILHTAHLNLKSRIFEKIRLSFRLSLFAFLFSAPITFFYFQTFSPQAPFTSFFISPFIAIFMHLSLLFVLLSFIFPAALPFYKAVLSFFYFVIVKIINFFSLFPVFRLRSRY